MDSAIDHQRSFDQLQAQYNLVLEQTGRMFAAMRRSQAPPTAQLHKLKQIVPSAQERVFDALSEMESELHRAKRILRRDLGICRERAALEKQGSVTDQRLESNYGQEGDSPTDGADPAKLTGDDAVINHANEDTTMLDAQMEPTSPPAVIVQQQHGAEMQVDGPNESSTLAVASSTSDPIITAPIDSGTASTETALHVDTQAANKLRAGEQPSEEDKVPNTADTTNNADLDSLFGGPMSAGATEANEFAFDHPTPPDFNFDSFSNNFDAGTADNDNISSFLPGLEDYVNPPPGADGAEVNLGIFGAPAAGGGQVGGDDDPNFDMIEFPNFDDAGNGEDGNTANHDTELDFDAIFG